MRALRPAAPRAPATGRGSGSRRVAFIAWGAVAGRPTEIADAVGGEARCFFPMGSRRRPPVLVRYLLSAGATALFLLRRRPKVVIVTNPPVPGALVTYLCARTVGAVVALDSHPGGFGAQGDRIAARLQWIHRWLVRRAAFVIVTDSSWRDRVREWGGRSLVVHEAPTGWSPPPPLASTGRLRVLVVGTFSVDEPVGAIMEAAWKVPGCDFVLTGEPSRCPAELKALAPSNVRLVGYLDPASYRDELAACHAVMTLTTEPTSVMRAAYEAVYARRPVVVSDWPVSRQLFERAVHTANDSSSLAAAIESLRADYVRYAENVEHAHVQQLERWEVQRRALLSELDRIFARDSEASPPARLVLDNLSERDAVERIVATAARGRGGRVSNVNVDILRQALADPLLAARIGEADLVLADGTPIVWAASLQGTPLVERVPASEMIWATCEEAARHSVGVFLLGGAPGTAARAAQLLSASFPGLRTGHMCPPTGFEHSGIEMAAIVKGLEDAGPGLVFCGFGAPKQERLMDTLSRRFPAVWFVACGGTFSMVTGDLPKAPAWMQRSSLEWLHRLRLEPRRLFVRYVIHDLPFALRLFVVSASVRLHLLGTGLFGVRRTLEPVQHLRSAAPGDDSHLATPGETDDPMSAHTLREIAAGSTQ